MRIKVRSLLGNQVLTLDDNATVDALAEEIRKTTTLQDFEVKFGFPPKPLVLEEYSISHRLADLPVKLAGEQLIVSAVNSRNGLQGSDAGVTQGVLQEERKETVYTSAQSKPADTPFSFTTGKPQPLASNKKGPINLTRAAPKISKDDPPVVELASGRGSLVLRVMDDDNSCLFRAISYVTSRSTMSAEELRGLVASTIQENPEQFNEVTLEQKPDQYCEWIQMDHSWGGGIELAILATFFDVEVVAVDVESGSMIRENQGRSSRVILVYSGIHYDAVALSPPYSSLHDSSNDTIQFSKDDEEILAGATELCRKLREKRYFTDTKNFDLKCNICGTGLKGAKAAQEHAKTTGHMDFGEYAA